MAIEERLLRVLFPVPARVALATVGVRHRDIRRRAARAARSRNAAACLLSLFEPVSDRRDEVSRPVGVGRDDRAVAVLVEGYGGARAWVGGAREADATEDFARFRPRVR